MAYRIFVQHKPVTLISDQGTYRPVEGSLFIHYDTPDTLRFVLQEYPKNPSMKDLCIAHTDLPELFTAFSSLFTVIEAAGGVVRNAAGQFLLIFRKGKWDLPKGKIDKGESSEVAAIREVEEECGVKGLTIVKTLETTFHMYALEDKQVLKKTYWYEMICEDSSAPKPQTDEGITEVKWMNKEEVKQAMKNTYPAINQLLEQY